MNIEDILIKVLLNPDKMDSGDLIRWAKKELSTLIQKEREELKIQFEKKIRILGNRAQKAKKYGGNVSNVEGQIRGIKWASRKVYDLPQTKGGKE